MSTRYDQRDPYVVCPYYRRESPTDIKCVGLIGTHTISCFANSRDKVEYKEDFCKFGNYRACALYQAISEGE